MTGPEDLTITRIEVEGDDISFFFDEDEVEQAWTPREFNPGSPTRLWLEAIEQLIRKGEVK